MIKDSNYINIQGWMVSNLKLSGTELIIFALIYGFSQDGESEFEGANKYICDWTNATRPTIRKNIKKLIAKGLIIRTEIVKNKLQFNTYKVSFQGVNKFAQGGQETLGGGGKETLWGGGQETLPNNNTLDNTSLDNNKESISAPKQNLLNLEIEKKEKKKSSAEKRKVLFVNSRYFDLLEFKKAFSGTQYGEFADLEYYYEAVKNWSASGGHKKLDWIATARNFMLGDKRENKLQIKNGIQNESTKHKFGNQTKNQGNFAGHDANDLFD
jgi:hypothetical protein